MSRRETGTPTAGAVKRAFAILECLDSSRRGLNISEMSRKLNIPKSSAHVIALTLERLGYIERSARGRQYSLGFRANILGQGLVRTMNLADAAQPHMKELAESLRLSAHLAVPDRDQGMFIQKVEAPGSLHVDTYVGRRMDLHCTGVGKVILAFGPAEIRDHCLAKSVFMRYTENTITSPKILLRELRHIRRIGYSIDDEEEELGVRCIAAPVWNASGRFVASLSVTGAAHQVQLDAAATVADALKRTAEAIRKSSA